MKSDLALTSLPGVGPAREEKLARIGVRSVRDLLCLVPRELQALEERVEIASVQGLPSGTIAIVEGAVRRVRFGRFGARRSVLRVRLEDESGEIDVLFFNQPWLKDRFHLGERIEIRGRAVDSPGRALVVLRLGSAERPLGESGSLLPIYPLAEGLSQEFLRGLCAAALERSLHELTETLPPSFLEQGDLPELPNAVQELHRPTSAKAFERSRARVSLESMMALLARLRARREARRQGRALALSLQPAEREALRSALPFTLTSGQQRVLEDVFDDLARTTPMSRLLQGDVGCGKTAIGILACLAAARAGAQAAFLAPTELLAEQHFEQWREHLEREGARAVLLSGSLPAAQRRAVENELSSGRAQIAFCTHAAFSPRVAYARLALAVIDEQHRFGVAQRMALLEKGRDVHALLMTATPIPRTLALTVYGDLDVSVLREKPVAFAPVRTHLVPRERRRDLARFLRRRLERGERLFWVCARIDSGESDTVEAEDGEREGRVGARDRHAAILRSSWARFGCELVHGRMEARDRNIALARFRSGEALILVATTVVEVGIDVPEASLIVIEDADCLGLAQLHQLRGRVGRLGQRAHCFFLAPDRSSRLRLLVREHDGFRVAEEDLRRRGAGELLGLRQAGESTEGLALAEQDVPLFLRARDWITEDPDLARAYMNEEIPQRIVP